MIPNWLRATLWVVVLTLGLWFAVKIRGTLAVFALAFLIAYLLNPIVSWLEKGSRLNRLAAIVVVYLLLLGVMAAVLSLMVPVAVDQGRDIANSLPEQMDQLRTKGETLWSQYLQRVPAHIRAQVQQTMNTIAGQAAAGVQLAFSKLTDFVSGFFSGVFFTLTGMLISIYILLRWNSMAPGILDSVPEAYREDALALGRQMNAIFGGYLRAVIVTSLVCGVATFTVLMVISGITGKPFPYTLIVSLIAGITYAIPIVGILVSTVMGSLLAFLSPEGSWGYAAAVAVSIFIVNTLIDRTLFPRLTGSAMGVSELFVLFGAFAGGEFLGVWGMLLGIPLSAMVKAFFTWFHARFLAVPGEIVPGSASPPPAVAFTVPPVPMGGAGLAYPPMPTAPAPPPGTPGPSTPAPPVTRQMPVVPASPVGAGPRRKKRR